MKYKSYSLLIGIGLSLSVFSTLSSALTYPPVFQGSEIFNFLSTNGGELPTTLEDLHQLAANTGQMTETIIPFSDTPFFTSLYEPRFVVSTSPKFYYSAIPRPDGSVDMEFLSWNNQRNEFDFGAINDFGKPTVSLATVDQTECMSCHMNHATLFSNRAWLNVTGANAPIGTYLSFAILQTMMDSDPSKYSRYEPIFQEGGNAYDPAFGNLNPEPAIALGPITYHGTPLFQLRGSFDLDANTRRGHYLAFTYQILDALTGDQKSQFQQGLVQAALLGVVYPSNIETLFEWDQYLGTWIQSVPSLAQLPANTSPVILNFQPLFNNPTLVQQAGIAETDIEKDPVAALVTLGKYVEKTQFKATPPENLPSTGNVFVALTPNHNGGADTALLLTGLTTDDATRITAFLGTHSRTIEAIYTDAAWQTLFTGNAFPTRENILSTLATLDGGSPSDLMPPAPNPFSTPTPTPVPPPIPISELPNHVCLSCHNSTPSGIAKAFPFDPASLSAWQNYYSDPNTHADAQLWVNAANARLSAQPRLMPPPGSQQAANFSPTSGDWPAILQFLSENAQP